MQQIVDTPAPATGEAPLSAGQCAVKGLEDKVLALLALGLLGPAMLAIALAVKLTSPGPVLFRQQRVGLHGRPITVYKFRSMSGPGQPTGEALPAAQRDARVTPLGRFLRRTSLDELPQLFNVLGGSMSLVGPRPHALAYHRLYARQSGAYMLRHRVKPGITGWAQVNGWRGSSEGPERIAMRLQHDLYYIEHWSLRFDLAILARTVLTVVQARNAW